ncbi:flavin reductase family protein [Microbacterium sp. SORGH_AS_0888]|uniref:flavin reductase family protein n=1 Tax=Microbacterium sp. SORGH_AS_0888 TaxID=3041791 RepID=UPI00278B08B1|nr:flavin reductase family protein [Microbacterium sp. SORGH_AS_0888]MDQ1129255.1 flavin reductase (DIM6/NTAB) family NADH-FMN oxidoreductase RutF [Microbacterium sp. SORGH_AS_0888]
MSRAELPLYDNDTAELRRAFSFFPSGVVALLAEVEGQPQGLVASAFTVGVSMDPPLVSCAVQRTSTTWPLLRGAARIGVTVLADGQGDLARQLSGRDRARRFDGVPLRETGSSARFIDGTPLWLECRLYAEHPAGDHTIALLEVTGIGVLPELEPLVFHRSDFRALQLTQEDLD